MAETKTCPKCGAELPSDAPAGICPKCLMLAGLPSEQDAGSRPEMKPTTLTSGFVPPEPEVLAKHFPQLEILELLGKGGMGAVYKARQPGLDRMVAVKILPPEVGADPAFAERFTREARALAKLSHQNIVSVFDSGEADGQYYFIMEYVDGTNLRHVIEKGAIKPEEALAIVPQICEALQFAHDEGIVHRDIKPENILVDKQGRVKIADFGLAKLLGNAPAEITLTGTHQAMGTLHYMAPEQMQGAGSVDHRADIYSLGVVFYEILTGQLPMGRFAAPSKKVQIDVRLDEVVLRSLESEPNRRYQHASDLKTDVEILSKTGGDASRTHEVKSVAAELQHVQNPADALVVVASLALLTAIGVVLWLWLVPNASLLKQQTKSTLQMMSATHVIYAAFILSAGLLMRRLRARMLVLVFVTIAGIAFPAMTVLNVVMEWGRVPQWPAIIPMWLGMPIAAWATIVLFRQNVRAAFRAESQRTRERNPDDIDESVPRFSRKAIVGACWAPFFFLALLSLFATVRSSPRFSEGQEDSSALSSVSVDGTVQTVADSDSATEPPREFSDAGTDLSGPAWWQWAVLGPVLLLGLTAPFGTTILGLVSINDIRHSQGRLTGMPLGLADSLLHPLLALDGLIVCMFWAFSFVVGPILWIGYEYLLGHETASDTWFWLYAGITAMLSLPACAYIDFRIVRAAWRMTSGHPDA